MTTHYDNITAVELIEFIRGKQELGWADPAVLADVVQELLNQMPPKKMPGVFARDDRVVVNQTSGFHRGAKGIVEFVEPQGNNRRIWVKRDGSSSAAFFWPSELDHEK